jgi:hypothetical protein
MNEQQVTTVLGPINQSDLTWVNTETDEGPVVIVAREWMYKGSDPQHAEQVGKVVRRDVWATIKCGQAAQAVSDL